MTDFADLHAGPLPLLLPNAWDVAIGPRLRGRRLPGDRDHQSRRGLEPRSSPTATAATRDANLALARALVRLPVPLSVDCEDGYADDPAEVAALRLRAGGPRRRRRQPRGQRRRAPGRPERLRRQGRGGEGGGAGRLRERPRRHLLVPPGRDGGGDARPGDGVRRGRRRTGSSSPGLSRAGRDPGDHRRRCRCRSTCCPCPGDPSPTSPRSAYAASAPARCPTAPPWPPPSRPRAAIRDGSAAAGIGALSPISRPTSRRTPAAPDPRTAPASHTSD